MPALAAGAAEQLAAAGLATAVACASMSASASASRRTVIRAGLDHLGIEPLTPGGVLVCDHRYPLSPGDVADRVLATLAEGYDAVVPTVPVTDTVKTVDQLGSVLTTVDRATLQTVQYPRGFTTSALWQLVEVSPALTPNAEDVDELDGALRAGLDVGRVDGDAERLSGRVAAGRAAAGGDHRLPSRLSSWRRRSASATSGREGHLEIRRGAGEDADVQIGVGLHARRGVGALEAVARRRAVRGE